MGDKNNISLKITLLFLLFGILTVAFNFLWFLFIEIPHYVTDYKNNLLFVAETAAKSISIQDHQTVITKDFDEHLPEYERMRSTLRIMANSREDITSVYTMTSSADPSKLVFVVDSFETKDFNGNGIIDVGEGMAYPGEIYDATKFPEMLAGLQTPSVDREPSTDKWGNSLSAYAPLLDKNGKTHGLVGVDVDAKKYIEYISDLKRGHIYVSAIYLVFVVILGLLLSREAIHILNQCDDCKKKNKLGI